MKGTWILVVSLRGVNFRFWSHLGCSVQNTTIFSRIKFSFRLALEEILKYIYFFNSFYSLDSCNQTLK